MRPRRRGGGRARPQRGLEAAAVLPERGREAGDGHHPRVSERVHHAVELAAVGRGGGHHVLVPDADGVEGLAVRGREGGGGGGGEEPEGGGVELHRAMLAAMMGDGWAGCGRK